MKGVSLRRQQRHSNQPNVSHGSDAPVSLVFRTHNEGLSKAAFLFCPKNFNLTNPTTTTASTAQATSATASSASPSVSTSAAATAAAARHAAVSGARESTTTTATTAGNAAASTLGSSSNASPSSRRLAQSAASPAASASGETVQTLVEAIIELRPSFAVPLFTASASSMNLSALSPGSPLTSTTNSLGDRSPSFQTPLTRPPSSMSGGLSSYMDLMTLNSFASPTYSPAGTNGAAASNNGGVAFGTVANASTGRFSEWPVPTAGAAAAASAAPSRSVAGPASSTAAVVHGFPPSPWQQHGSATGQHMGSGGAGNSGGGGGGGAENAGGGGVSGSGNAPGSASTGAGAAGGCAATSAGHLMHPSGGWICRAMAFNEKEVSHANGAISVSQSLTSKCPLINEVAKGKIMARILSSYAEVQERYGLSHVELTVDNQYVSRSDMFLISEALRERILYEGEEIHVCGFRIRVREMLQVVASPSSPVASSPAIPISAASGAPVGGGAGGPNSGTGAGGNSANPGTASAATAAATAAASTPASYMRVGCGIVLPTTRVNFQSLSPVHYILVELSREMWETTIDGRIALTWAIRKFISELLLKQLPKRKASPLVRVVFTGRLQRAFQFGRHSDVFHMLELPREVRNVDVVEEIRMHCEALVERVLREVKAAAWKQLEAEVQALSGAGGGVGEPPSRPFPASPAAADGAGGSTDRSHSAQCSPASAAPPGSERDAVLDSYVQRRQAFIESITAKRIFVHAKQANTLEALSILLERCTHHYIDRHLTLTGHAVTVVSAGKGFYQVTNSLVQSVCARLHDMGLEKVHVVCIGRPPLHVTPLLEYTSDDDTLRSQYHLHSRLLSGAVVRGGAPRAPWEVERYYETPEWIAVFFFHSALHNNGGETVFELLPKECWQRQHPLMASVDTLWQRSQAQASPSVLTGASSPESARLAAGAGRSVSGSPGSSAGALAWEGGEEDGQRFGHGSGGATGGLMDADDVAAHHLPPQPSQPPTATAGSTAATAAATAPATGSVGSAATANPPLLIPGLGLRSYPVADVTLPVQPAELRMIAAMGQRYVDRWGGSGTAGAAANAHRPGGLILPASPSVATPARFGYAGLPDFFDVSGTGSLSTERAAASPTSPLHAPYSHLHHLTTPLAARAAQCFSPSSISGAGGGCSSPLLVRTTTASSSVFASPNIPARGSMPRGNSGAAAMREAPHPHLGPHGLQRFGSSSSVQMAHPPASPQLPHRLAPQQAGCTASITLNSSSGGGARGGEALAWGSAQQQQQRRSARGTSSGTGGGPAAHHLQAYLTGSSSALSTAAGLAGYGHARTGRHSHPNSLTSYGTSSSHPPLHISRSFDHKTTANPEYHSLGAFEHSVRSAGSSSLGRPHASSHPPHRPLLWRETPSPTKLSTNSVAGLFANAAAAAAGSGNAGPVAGPGQFEDVFAGPSALCTWYCLHAAKLHHDGGNSGIAGGGVGMGGGAGTISGGLHSTVAGRSCSVPSPSRNALAQLPTDGVGELPSVLPTFKPWHKSPSGTRADAVYCGCNVVDSDLRNGYLILEITINAEALPDCFWSPRLLIDNAHWSFLMTCFSGRDDRLTIDDDSDAFAEDEADDEGVEGGVDDRASLDVEARFGDDDAAAAAAVADRDNTAGTASDHLRADSHGRSGPATGAGAATNDGSGSGAHSTASAAGDIYRFQSDFRPTEVFCRSHSGITVDGRTLVIPTHNNSVHFQSSEEILLRLHPQLFVRAVDEGGDVALEHHGPVSPLSSHHAHHDGSAAFTDGETTGDASRSVEANASTSGGEHLSSHRDTNNAVDPAVNEVEGPRSRSERAALREKSTTSSVLVSPKADHLLDRHPTPEMPSSDLTAGGADACRSDGASPHRPQNTAAAAITTNASFTVAPGDAASMENASVEETVREEAATASAGGEAAALLAASPNTLSTADAPVVLSRRSSPSAQPPPTDGSNAAAAVTATPSTTVARPAALRMPPPTPNVTHVTTATPVAAPTAGGESAPLNSRGGAVAHLGFAPSLSLRPPEATITVGYVQLRNSLLFAIKPINPLRPGAEEEQREDTTALSQSAESVSTATVLRRRWQWKHPDTHAAEPPHLASWTRLCTCRLLPVYGSKPAYPREGFYTVSPHQYTVTNPGAAGSHADPAEERKRLLEFVLQRLQQQYQIVVDSSGLAAGAQWPRADPTPNARLEMSLGHQTHTLKVGETAKTISVTRMLHRGMYSNGQVTHMLSYRYLLWNYLADEFSPREVHMEAQVGERNAFRWESLDRWLQERPEAFIPRGPDLWMRSREVAVMLLPEDPAHPPSFEEFYRFIGYRFSVHLSTHGKVEWKQHESGLALDISPATPSSFPPAPPLMEVVLVHDNPLTLDTRNVMDRVNGRTIAFEVPVEERYMSVDVSLPQQYDSHCCYFLKVSWLVCAASIVVDWFGSFIANASRFHFHAVPMACYYNSPKAESLTAHYDVEAASLEEEPALRRTLVELLVSPAYRYYPDTPVVTRNCRLVHLSGLCCVNIPPNATTVAQWYQNACLRQGSVEQLELLVQFKEAVKLARERVAAQGPPVARA